MSYIFIRRGNIIFAAARLNTRVGYTCSYSENTLARWSRYIYIFGVGQIREMPLQLYLVHRLSLIWKKEKVGGDLFVSSKNNSSMIMSF